VRNLLFISAQDLKRIDELLYNPFAARIADIFSEDGSGRLSFKNFLELFSVFSPRASFDVKVIFLFAIWDFDGVPRLHPRLACERMLAQVCKKKLVLLLVLFTAARNCLHGWMPSSLHG